jgi:DNA-binding FadR family transcriptional regulator
MAKPDDPVTLPEPPGLDLRPQKRERLADSLHGQLLQRIAAGHYAEGDRLPTEKELCAIFAVSRPVVREALLRLQADGLVVARQGAGTFVKRRPPRRMAEAASAVEISGFLLSFEVRLPLEGQAARLAARRRDEGAIARIEEALAGMRKAIAAGHPAERHDFAFHRAVAAATGNDLFVFVLEQIEPQVGGTMEMALGITREGSSARARRVVEEHERILEAIREGDPDTADLAMRHHLVETRRRLTDRDRDA